MRLPQTLTALPREARDTLFMLLVIAWVIAPQSAHLPLWASAFAAALLLWRGALAWRGQPLPRPWVAALLLALALAATWASYRTIIGRDPGVTLIVILLGLKTLEMRARRDAMVIFFLGFFTLLSNFFFSQSLAVAAAMLVGLLGLLTALVNAHLPVGRPPLAQSQLYFRGPVLGQFDGRSWRSTSMQNGPAWVASSTAAANLQVQGEPLRYAVTLEPHRRPWLLVLDAAPERPEISGTAAGSAFMGSDLQWFATRAITEVTRYRATSYPQFRHGPLGHVDNARGTDPLVFLTYLPDQSNPRTALLAQQLLAEPAVQAGGTPALIEAALQRLRTGGYTYTLEPGLYGEHSADEFWFDKKAGFCEHIASAFAVLMRAAKVPARIVTGYQGGELNSVDGYWTVRQSDAHAWTEVWLEGRGWVRVDPTGAVSPGRVGQFQRLLAPRSLFSNAMGAVISPGMSQQLRAVWEAANNRWNQWVLNYTQTRQLDLLKSIGFETPSWQDLARLLAGVVGAVALAGAAWALWERRQHDPWLRLLASTRQRLARAGLALPDSTPPRRMAQLAQAHFGASADPLAQWLVQLEQKRYGASAAAAPAQLRRLQRQARQLPWPIAPSA